MGEVSGMQIDPLLDEVLAGAGPSLQARVGAFRTRHRLRLDLDRVVGKMAGADHDAIREAPSPER